MQPALNVLMQYDTDSEIRFLQLAQRWAPEQLINKLFRLTDNTT